jgi:hypothetical protein
MVGTVSNFKGYIMLVIMLLQSQQVFAALLPMNCDDMKNVSIVSQVNHPDVTSPMHEHNASSQEQMSSHDKCDTCNLDDCRCSDIGLCFSSSYTMASQSINGQHDSFIDVGQKFISSDEFPISGIALHPFRPPILS